MRKKKREEKEVMNVHHAQYREKKGMKKMREFVIFFWLCSMAEHIKLGSNPSSQYLSHLVCYILHIFVNNTHINIINRFELTAIHYSQAKSLILIG